VFKCMSNFLVKVVFKSICPSGKGCFEQVVVFTIQKMFRWIWPYEGGSCDKPNWRKKMKNSWKRYDRRRTLRALTGSDII